DLIVTGVQTCALPIFGKQAKLKVLGTRHCFNKIADSTTEFLSLKPADELLSVNAAERTVTVDGSMTYGHLCPLLHEQGFALHNRSEERRVGKRWRYKG